MLDPSFLFSDDGIAFLEEGHDLPNNVVVPRTVLELVRSSNPAEYAPLLDVVARGDRASFEQRRRQVLISLSELVGFDLQQASVLKGPISTVHKAVLAPGDPVAAIYGEEWGFLWTNSWLLSKSHRPLDRFRHAGAAVLEYGQKLRDRMIATVLPDEPMPAVITPELLAKAEAKWLIVGGIGTIGASLGSLGGALGAAIAIPVVQAFDP